VPSPGRSRLRDGEPILSIGYGMADIKALAYDYHL
jgi:hypothetical protein